MRSTTLKRSWWLAALMCCTLCGSSQTIKAESGSRFSITGSLALRSIDGRTYTGGRAVDITATTVSGFDLRRSGTWVYVQPVLPDPHGYELNSKLFYGSALQVNYRFWRRLQFVLSVQGYASKTGGSTLTWSAETVGLDNGMRGSLQYQYKFIMAEIKLLLEYHFGTRGFFLRAGLERFGYWIERSWTWQRYLGDSLLYSKPQVDTFGQVGSALTAGVGHSLRLSSKLKLINVLSFSGGHMTRGIRFESGLRYHF